MKTLIFLLVLGISSNLAAGFVPQQSMEAITQKSSMVFEGKVTDVKSLKIRDNFFTDVTFEISDLMKGRYEAKNVTLRYKGGFVGGFGEVVTGMKMPKKNEHGIYFVADNTKFYTHPLTGWGQGHFILKDNGLEYNVESSLGAAILKVEDDGMLKRDANVKRKAVTYNSFMARGLESDVDGEHAGLTAQEFKSSIRSMMSK